MPKKSLQLTRRKKRNTMQQHVWEWLTTSRRGRSTITVTALSLGLYAVFAIYTAPDLSAQLVEGQMLFNHEWQERDSLSPKGDGLGPVFNAKSCVACHFQAGVGGGGDLVHNVHAFEVLPAPQNLLANLSGVIHSSATSELLQESIAQVQRSYPIIKGGTRVQNGCQQQVADFDPIVQASINTPALFGVGLIDSIPDRSITWPARRKHLEKVSQEFNLNFNKTQVGKPRALGMSVGKFGWKGQFATLEEFVATACAVELGLTNPHRAQDAPGQHQPDSTAQLDMTSAQLQSLVAFCRELPRPTQVLPEEPQARAQVAQGEAVFSRIGCTDCHTQKLGDVEGLFSDLLLHRMEDEDNGMGYARQLPVPLPANRPNLDEWKTPPLWGVADSAPYFHDGASTDLLSAITRHAGEAKRVAKRFKESSPDDREALIAFLKTLKAPRVPKVPTVPVLAAQ